MKKISPALILLAALAICSKTYAAEEGETATLIKRITPPMAVVERKVEEKDRIYGECYYEPSSVLQGNRTGQWSELDTIVGYTHKNITGYAAVCQFDRFVSKDYTANIGAYFSFKNSYLHLEEGFGWDVDYMYKFQSINEYGHKLYKTLYWQMGYTYRGYGTDDSHIVYPGLVYYFGDSYIAGNLGIGMMEARDTATFCNFNGNFTITRFLKWNCGVSVGQRLYDIYGLDADQEFGYILTTGVTVNVYKGINVKVGYSYGTEEPKFVKRSLYFDLSAKF